MGAKWREFVLSNPYEELFEIPRKKFLKKQAVATPEIKTVGNCYVEKSGQVEGVFKIQYINFANNYFCNLQVYFILYLSFAVQ